MALLSKELFTTALQGALGQDLMPRASKLYDASPEISMEIEMAILHAIDSGTPEATIDAIEQICAQAQSKDMRMMAEAVLDLRTAKSLDKPR
jgi:hypothetical protein